MTDLSLAAKVLDAFLNGYTCRPSSNVAFEADRNGLASALCAAAMLTLLTSEHYKGSTPNDYELGWNAAVAYIQTIARELEAL